MFPGGGTVRVDVGHGAVPAVAIAVPEIHCGISTFSWARPAGGTAASALVEAVRAGGGTAPQPTSVH